MCWRDNLSDAEYLRELDLHRTYRRILANLPKWSPNPAVVDLLKKQAEAAGNASDQVEIEGRAFTWAELVMEVEIGTPLGKKYHDATLRSLENSARGVL